MIRPIESGVFKNHHDTWSHLTEATNDDGVRVAIHGRCNTRREAAAAAKRAEIALERCLEALKV